MNRRLLPLKGPLFSLKRTTHHLWRGQNLFHINTELGTTIRRRGGISHRHFHNFQFVLLSHSLSSLFLTVLYTFFDSWPFCPIIEQFTYAKSSHASHLGSLIARRRLPTENSERRLPPATLCSQNFSGLAESCASVVWLWVQPSPLNKQFSQKRRANSPERQKEASTEIKMKQAPSFRNANFSVDDDCESSSSESSRDELAEVKKLVDKESKNIGFWRLIVCVAIVLVGAAVTWMTHNFLSNDETNNFEKAVSRLIHTVSLDQPDSKSFSHILSLGHFCRSHSSISTPPRLWNLPTSTPRRLAKATMPLPITSLPTL